MNTLLEALRELRKSNEPGAINESFAGLDYHYDKHVATTIPELSKKLTALQKEKPNYDNEALFVGLTKEEYEQEAQLLSNEPFADATKTSTISGIMGFRGSRATDNYDSFYIIRKPSKLLSEDYLKNKGIQENLISIILDMFKGKGNQDLVDVCIIKAEDGYQNTRNKTISTFYPARATKIENLKNTCLDANNFAQINQAKKDQKLILIPGYYVNTQKDLRAYVVSPTSITENSLDRGERGVDNMLAYKRGEYLTSNSEKITFDTKKEVKTLRDDEDNKYVLSSRTPSEAKHTFEIAASKSIFTSGGEGNTNFRQSYIGSTICRWLSSKNEINGLIRNDTAIERFIERKLGVSSTDDYHFIENAKTTLIDSLRRQWDELDKGK